MTSTATPPVRLRDLPSASERHRIGRSRRRTMPREALASVPHTDPLEAVCRLAGEEARPSVLEAYLPGERFEHHGERVVAGQRRIQAGGDAFLGWQWRTGPDGRTTDYYVRQLRDGTLSADLESMTPERLAVQAKLCGWTLAKAHARSGDRFAIAGYLGSSEVVDEALTHFAERYADCVVAQYAAVRTARGPDREGAGTS